MVKDMRIEWQISKDLQVKWNEISPQVELEASRLLLFVIWMKALQIGLSKMFPFFSSVSIISDEVKAVSIYLLYL